MASFAATRNNTYFYYIIVYNLFSFPIITNKESSLIFISVYYFKNFINKIKKNSEKITNI